MEGSQGLALAVRQRNIHRPKAAHLLYKTTKDSRSQYKTIWDNIRLLGRGLKALGTLRLHMEGSQGLALAVRQRNIHRPKAGYL
jgi:hypothetical protein